MLRLFRSSSLFRIASGLTGGIFILAALAKAWSFDHFLIQFAAYRLIQSEWLLFALAVLVILAEASLGVLLLAGTNRPRIIALNAFFLLSLTAGLAYSDWFHEIEDCGCFGEWLALSPMETYLKNAILFVLILISREPVIRVDKKKNGTMVIGLMLVSLLMIFWPRASIQQSEIPLLQSDQLGKILQRDEVMLAFLTPCGACREFIPKLNELAEDPNIPEIHVLYLGEDAKSEEILSSLAVNIHFHKSSPTDFFRYLRDKPPELQLWQKNRLKNHWGEHLPPKEELLFLLFQ